MFTCSRIKNDLIIQINFKKLLWLLVGCAMGLIFTVWFMWAVVFKYEIIRIKNDIYTAVSNSMGEVMVQNFNKTHTNLLRLEACQAQLLHEISVNKDLSLMISKMDPDKMVAKEVVKAGGEKK